MSQLQIDGRPSVKDRVIAIAKQMPRNTALRDLAKECLASGVFDDETLDELALKGVMERCKRALKSEHPHHNGLPCFLPTQGDYWVQLELLTKEEAFYAYTSREEGIFKDVKAQLRFRDYLMETFGDAPPALVEVSQEANLI